MELLGAALSEGGMVARVEATFCRPGPPARNAWECRRQKPRPRAYTELVKIYLTDIPSFTLMYRPQSFHAVNALEKAMGDPDADLRRQIAFSLKRANTPRAIVLLKKLQSDTDASVRIMAGAAK